MRFSAMVLILYSISMLSYGSLEMAHDLLHYLAKHHHSTLHSHSHDHHHSVHDHEHSHSHSHSHVSQQPVENDQQESSLTTPINFFLFFQSRAKFDFRNLGWQAMSAVGQLIYNSISLHPGTPPPR